MIEVINNDMFKGATIKHLQKDEFKNIEFNIQPLNEQKRIVEKLDTCMEQIEKSDSKCGTEYSECGGVISKSVK